MFFKRKQKAKESILFNLWFMELVDGTVISFHWDKEDTNPLKRIKKFDGGDYWRIPVSEDLAKDKKFNLDPTSSNVYLIPKNQLKRVFYKQ